MKLKDIYNTAIIMGIEADPRGKDKVEKELAHAKQKYDKMVAAKKQQKLELFDVETLTNPYSDTRILYGNHDLEVKTVMMGIDMEVGELVLADTLKAKGRQIDLLLAHHPEGNALAALSGVMHMHADLMAKNGVLPNVAEGIMGNRIKDVFRSVAVSNHQRAVNAATLLDQPFMCIHTPADNLVTGFVTKHLAAAAPEKVSDIIQALLEIPEYKTAAINNNPPNVAAGDKKSSAGKIFVDFTGGTSGAGENYKRLAEAGISTVIAMHCTDAHIKAAKEHYLNIVIASHIGSDSIGCNLFLDALEKQGVEIIPVSGLIRVSRN